jgi:hypothetical protein
VRSVKQLPIPVDGDVAGLVIQNQKYCDVADEFVLKSENEQKECFSGKIGAFCG